MERSEHKSMFELIPPHGVWRDLGCKRSAVLPGTLISLRDPVKFCDIISTGRGAAWISALAWGARGPRFESARPDQPSLEWLGYS